MKKYDIAVFDVDGTLLDTTEGVLAAVIYTIKKYNLPTVYTAHDLKMLCLNYKMMHHGHICEECKNQRYYKCAQNKCVKDSLAKSCINVVEGYFHKWKHSYDVIDKIITPSNFYKKKFEEFGIERNRVEHIPNFLDTEKPIINVKDNCEKYYLYFGRLSEEKGVFTLIRAFEQLDVKLFIVGTGPVGEKVKEYILKNNIQNVQILGFMSGQSLKDIVGNAKAVILPSEWYENGPYSAIEALQLGRPIIGADIGGIPELINENGFLFTSGSSRELTQIINKIEELPKDQYEILKQKSISNFNEIYTREIHYKKIMKTYEEVLAKYK